MNLRGRLSGGGSTPPVDFAGRDLGDTIYLTVADGQGNVVSLIQSLFDSFGSGIVAGDTGITLHNRGSGFVLTPELVGELARHLVAYLMAGILGLDQLLLQVKIVALGADGLDYALAPITNLVRFVIGTGDYFMVVNSLYVIIHPGDLIDSNVFTLFGSLLYRGGWVGAIAITLAYALLSYWIWSRWRMRESALASAAGSWWMAPLLFAWFDPYFPTFSFMEIMIILAVRGSLRLPRLVERAPRSAAASISAQGY